MRVWSTVLFLAIALAIATFERAGAPIVRAQSRPEAFRSGVDLVSFTVTVTDAAQRYVPDLGREDFLVFEAGIPRPLTLFRQSEVPLALALLLDTSGSMEQTLSTAREAAIAFTRHLRPSDVAGLFAFNSVVSMPQRFTHDVDAVQAAIRRSTAAGSTTLYTAVYIALRELDRLKVDEDDDTLRRRAIVLLSDGHDNAGPVDFDDVLDLAVRSNTVIYCIGLTPPGPDLVPLTPATSGRFVLREFARQTGGRAFFIDRGKDLADAYRQIHAELSSQYTLAYEWDGRRDGQWRDVSVRVNRPGHTARTRLGYYAPTR